MNKCYLYLRNQLRPSGGIKPAMYSSRACAHKATARSNRPPRVRSKSPRVLSPDFGYTRLRLYPTACVSEPGVWDMAHRLLPHAPVSEAQLASGPTSTTTPATYVASFIVYMAHIVALATATEAKRPMTDGNPVVYTFDVYASLLWCCRKIKEGTYLGTTPFTANHVFELLREEWRQDQPYSRDEAASILWASFISDANSANGKIANGVNKMNANIAMPGGKKTSSFFGRGSTPSTVQAEQEARIEAFFAEFLSYSVGLKQTWTDGPDWGATGVHSPFLWASTSTFSRSPRDR
jgi:hypothetical protein